MKRCEEIYIIQSPISNISILNKSGGLHDSCIEPRQSHMGGGDACERLHARAHERRAHHKHNMTCKHTHQDVLLSSRGQPQSRALSGPPLQAEGTPGGKYFTMPIAA